MIILGPSFRFERGTRLSTNQVALGTIERRELVSTLNAKTEDEQALVDDGLSLDEFESWEAQLDAITNIDLPAIGLD